MYLYLASTRQFRALSMYKIGCSENPQARLQTYLTGCPPGIDYEITFDGIWETVATTRDELFDYEELIHEHFIQFRMMRKHPGDSEWFHFRGQNPLDMIIEFLSRVSWIKRRVAIDEIIPHVSVGRFLRRQTPRNLGIIKTIDARRTLLEAIQAPITAQIETFIAARDSEAGYIVAPCGSGKTIMVCEALRNVMRVVVCVPTTQVQTQWRESLIRRTIFASEYIYLVGYSGTTSVERLHQVMDGDKWCIITTYTSSHLLVDLIGVTRPNLLVLDEAHHLVGIVATESSGEGRTRRLMAKAIDLRIKRLSMTFTPRIACATMDADFLTMDDDRAFGSKIAELRIRDFITRGLLPDYRIWVLQDEARHGHGLIGKAECLLEAWSAVETYREQTRATLHHMIIFAQRICEAQQFTEFFETHTHDTRVFHATPETNLSLMLAQFEAASRAILVNCLVLGEGIDIPCANAVAIMYPKQSRGQITQMILRAGRWYPDKSMFHVLIPVLDFDEDLSALEEVLITLASCDDKIMEEVKFRGSPPSMVVPNGSIIEEHGASAERIIFEEFGSIDIARIKQHFMDAKRKIVASMDRSRIRNECAARGIDTPLEYSHLRIAEMQEWPEDPRHSRETWFDFLHPHNIRDARISLANFRQLLTEHKLSVGCQYDAWRSRQSIDIIAHLPSVQHINDGYFGDGWTDFNRINVGIEVTISRRRSNI